MNSLRPDKAQQTRQRNEHNMQCIWLSLALVRQRLPTIRRSQVQPKPVWSGPDQVRRLWGRLAWEKPSQGLLTRLGRRGLSWIRCFLAPFDLSLKSLPLQAGNGRGPAGPQKPAMAISLQKSLPNIRHIPGMSDGRMGEERPESQVGQGPGTSTSITRKRVHVKEFVGQARCS